MTEDPLNELLIDSAAVDREAIVVALRNYIGIDTTSRNVVTKDAFTALSARQKIVALLLGAKARFLLGSGSEALTPAEIASSSGVPPGTVRPTLRALARQHVISNNHEGYSVAHHQIPGAIALLARPKPQKAKTSDPGRPAAKHSGGMAKRKRAGNAAGKRKKKPPRHSSGVTSADIRSLVDDGFFDQQRTLQDIQAYLKRRQGLNAHGARLSTIMLRLLRAGIVERDENDEGQYAYAKLARD